ncbi:MAG TPA: primosomal protein N' [Firmicutes bacterium]|jgi:primosomal protein N' (replication factor Y)|nr:primosomal protein N' [Bacillota bacterium]
MAFAEVWVDVAGPVGSKAFDYQVPPDLATRAVPGTRVLVPFGRRRVLGFLRCRKASPAVSETRPILNVLDDAPLLSLPHMELAEGLARYYHCGVAEFLRLMLPPPLRVAVRKKTASPNVFTAAPDVARQLAAGRLRRAPQQEKALRFVLQHGAVARQELASLAGVSLGVVDALRQKGLLVPVDPSWSGESDQHVPELTDHQRTALTSIRAALDAGRMEMFLLHGVTGSGKTEVYLRSCQAALAKGRQAIVLVPELSLTPQMIEVFQARFGYRLAVLHSRLAAGERWREWTRIRAGQARVVLGARSAIFAPCHRPGLIILDEEHEFSYKQENSPRYHARYVAEQIAHKFGCVLLLGSATPAVESYQAACQGEYRLLELPERIEARPLPQVLVVDMRAELQSGNRTIFSRALTDGLANCLLQKEQAILFLNRRGFSTFILCRECGTVIRCPHCSVSLTYHQSDRLLHCHYCGRRRRPPDTCPTCGTSRIRSFGAGTQRVEEEVRRHWPQARVLRMDVDTTGRKGAHEAIWRRFRSGEADVLVGTQMVAKGLDVAGVTLVGVVAADTALHLPDFRAAERTFQVLTQVAGRAGRGAQQGRVVIQTYNPDHFAIQMASRHDYRAFFARELRERQTWGFPPFGRLGKIICRGKKCDDVARLAEVVAEAAEKAGVDVLGPAPAPLERIKDVYRWQVLVRSHPGHPGFDAAVAAAMVAGREVGGGELSVDIDPMDMM